MSAELVPHTVGPLPSTAAPASGRHDVDTDLAEWLLEYRSDNTRLTYANVLGTRWHPLTGQPRDTSGLLNGLAWLPLCERAGLHPYEATRRDVLAWLDALATTPQQRGRGAGQPLGKASRANALSALAAYYGWLVEQGRIGSTPVVVNRGRLELRVPQESPTRSLSEGEVVAMLDAAASWSPATTRPRTRALLAFMLTTGCRVSEVCALTTDDFSTDQGKRVARLRAKGERAHQVYVDEWVYQVLCDYWADRASGGLVLAGQQGAAQPAFSTLPGRPLTRTQVVRIVRAVARRAGLSDPESVTPHVLRHTNAALADALGVPLDQQQRQLGHRSISTTMRYGARRQSYDASPARVIGAWLAARAGE